MSDLVTKPDKSGTVRLTAAGHKLLHNALMRSVKVLYTCKRAQPTDGGE